MGKLLFFLNLCKKIFFLFAVFIVFALQGSFFVYLENLVACFPVTIITTQKAPVEQVLDMMTVCSLSVESERMTFDSSIFNHYETLPVKEIYLYSMKIPYSEWSGIKNMEDVITEANPYVEDVVSLYASSKIKFQLLSFVFTMLLGIYFVFRIAESKKMTKKQYLFVFAIILISYAVCSALLLISCPMVVMPLSAVSAGVLFAAFVIVSLITYRLSKW